MSCSVRALKVPPGLPRPSLLSASFLSRARVLELFDVPFASGGIEQCAAEIVRGDDIHANNADLRMSGSFKRGRCCHQAQIRNHLAAAAQIASDTDVIEALRAKRLGGVFQQLFGAVGAHAAFGAARKGGAFEDLALKGCTKTF